MKKSKKIRKVKSTYEREVEDPEYSELLNKEFNALLLSD
jgi:hypothetical protein